MKNLITAYMQNNWKTTLSGSLILGIVGLRLSGLIDSDAMVTCLATLAGYGFIVSKDASRKDLPK